MKISLTIRRLLTERGRSQKELAEFLGVSENGLSGMLKKDKYKVETLDKIAKFLNVTATELQGGNSAEEPAKSPEYWRGKYEQSQEELKYWREHFKK